MLYRAYLLDIEHNTDTFLAANLGRPTEVADTWLANPRAWNMSYAMEADSLDSVFTRGNTTNRTWRGISVGDIIEHHGTKACFLVAPNGFLNVGRPKDACPHSATLTPHSCEFCAWDDYDRSVANGDEPYNLPF